MRRPRSLLLRRGAFAVVLGLCWVGTVTVAGARDVPETIPLVEVGPEALESPLGVFVDRWALSCVDSPEAATPGVPAGSASVRWVPVEWLLPPGEGMPCEWTGVGWLRVEVSLPESAVGKPLAFRAWQSGAYELWWDGDRVGSVGTVGSTPESTEPRFQQVPLIFVPETTKGVLAVRFANHWVDDYLRVAIRRVVRGQIALPENLSREFLELARGQERSLFGFCGVFLSFGLVHFLLWAFDRSIRSNLDFALLCSVLASLVFLLVYRFVQPDPRFILLSEPLMNLNGLALGFVAVFFVQRLFDGRLGPTGWSYLAFCVPLGIWAFVQPTAVRAVFWMMLLGFVEMLRTVVVAAWRGRPGARVVGFGAATLCVGFGIGLLGNLGVIPRNEWTSALIPFSSFLVLLLAMSVHLAQRVAALHRELAAQLDEVRRLGAEKLETERRRHEAEVQQSELRLQVEQKTRELEEARALQLSMLPRELPQLPDLEIAAFMQTASEVGGDYYDFAIAEDGHLTVAIGDATGHGLRAGTMVTATKSLFNALAVDGELLETLGRSSLALKRMNLRKLAMALTLVRYRYGRMRIASAGMPPPMVWRAASRDVETLMVGGMPLGSLPHFPYRTIDLEVAAGDVVLLMSDGFPERLDPRGDLLGYEAALEAFREVADRSPEDVVAALRERGEEWAAGKPPDDDVTFVVLRAREVQ